MIYSENLFICVAAPLLLALFFTEKGARRFICFLILGMTISMVSAYINGFAALLAGMDAHEAALFCAPVIEELMKFLPLLYYLLIYPGVPSGLVSVSVAIGSGFAIFENMNYILSAGTESLPFMLQRGFVVGVMHLVCTAAAGIGLTALAKRRQLLFSGSIGILSLTITFHSVYNLLVSESGITMAAACCIPALGIAGLYLVYEFLEYDKIN